MSNEPEDATRDDGTVRRQHYGSGRQPWDDIKDAGWGPHFAAANVLKYLRRTKDPEHSLESARWYFERLREVARAGVEGQYQQALFDLLNILTPEEKDRLK